MKSLLKIFAISICSFLLIAIFVGGAVYYKGKAVSTSLNLYVSEDAQSSLNAYLSTIDSSDLQTLLRVKDAEKSKEVSFKINELEGLSNKLQEQYSLEIYQNYLILLQQKTEAIFNQYRRLTEGENFPKLETEFAEITTLKTKFSEQIDAQKQFTLNQVQQDLSLFQNGFLTFTALSASFFIFLLLYLGRYIFQPFIHIQHTIERLSKGKWDQAVFPVSSLEIFKTYTDNLEQLRRYVRDIPDLTLTSADGPVHLRFSEKSAQAFQELMDVMSSSAKELQGSGELLSYLVKASRNDVEESIEQIQSLCGKVASSATQMEEQSQKATETLNYSTSKVLTFGEDTLEDISEALTSLRQQAEKFNNSGAAAEENLARIMQTVSKSEGLLLKSTEQAEKATDKLFYLSGETSEKTKDALDKLRERVDSFVNNTEALQENYTSRLQSLEHEHAGVIKSLGKMTDETDQLVQTLEQATTESAKLQNLTQTEFQTVRDNLTFLTESQTRLYEQSEADATLLSALVEDWRAKVMEASNASEALQAIPDIIQQSTKSATHLEEMSKNILGTAQATDDNLAMLEGLVQSVSKTDLTYKSSTKELIDLNHVLSEQVAWIKGSRTEEESLYDQHKILVDHWRLLLKNMAPFKEYADDLKPYIDQLQIQQQGLQEQILKLENAADSLGDFSEKTQKSEQEFSQSFAETKESFAKSSEELSKIMTLLDQKEGVLQEYSGRVATQIDVLQGVIGHHDRQLGQWTSLLKKAEPLPEYAEKLAPHITQLSEQNDQVSAEIAKLRANRAELEGLTLELQNEQTALTAQEEALGKVSERLQGTSDQLQENSGRVMTQVDVLQGVIGHHDRQIAQWEALLKKAQPLPEYAETLSPYISKLAQQHDQISSEITQLRENKESLRSLVSDLENEKDLMAEQDSKLAGLADKLQTTSLQLETGAKKTAQTSDTLLLQLESVSTLQQKQQKELERWDPIIAEAQKVIQFTERLGKYEKLLKSHEETLETYNQNMEDADQLLEKLHERVQQTQKMEKAAVNLDKHAGNIISLQTMIEQKQQSLNKEAEKQRKAVEHQVQLLDQISSMEGQLSDTIFALRSLPEDFNTDISIMTDAMSGLKEDFLAAQKSSEKLAKDLSGTVAKSTSGLGELLHQFEARLEKLANLVGASLEPLPEGEIPDIEMALKRLERLERMLRKLGDFLVKERRSAGGANPLAAFNSMLGKGQGGDKEKHASDVAEED